MFMLTDYIINAMLRPEP